MIFAKLHYASYYGLDGPRVHAESALTKNIMMPLVHQAIIMFPVQLLSTVLTQFNREYIKSSDDGDQAFFLGIRRSCHEIEFYLISCSCSCNERPYAAHRHCVECLFLYHLVCSH